MGPRRGVRRVLERSLAAVAFCVVAAPVSAQSDTNEPLAPWQRVIITLNGRPMADGLARPGGEVFVAVESLSRAVDGSGITRTQSRLSITDQTLTAAAVGGCRGCPVRIARTVRISRRLRDVGGSIAVPLDDIVAAFEGRLTAHPEQRRYEIHAGTCTWCILEPSPSSSTREQQ